MLETSVNLPCKTMLVAVLFVTHSPRIHSLIPFFLRKRGSGRREDKRENGKDQTPRHVEDVLHERK